MLFKFQRISCLIAITFIWVTIGQAAAALQILEDEQKLVLTGEISKALGTYDEHLKGAVEYLLCGPGGKEYESIIVVNSFRTGNPRRNAQTRCREGHPAYVRRGEG